MFIVTVAYELGEDASKAAHKLLRAELVGRRFQDHFEGRAMPAGCVWGRRTTEPGENVEHLRTKATRELVQAVAAVAARGLPIKLVSAWVQVTGAGTWGLVDKL